MAVQRTGAAGSGGLAAAGGTGASGGAGGAPGMEGSGGRPPVTPSDGGLPPADPTAEPDPGGAGCVPEALVHEQDAGGGNETRFEVDYDCDGAPDLCRRAV